MSEPVVADQLAFDAPAARQLSRPSGPPPPAVRPALARLVDDLNPSQRAAVEHRGGPLLIVAGAGSGKTRVLTRRIAHLLATGDAEPGQILAITFTNKAAGEMKERVAELVGRPRPRHVGLDLPLRLRAHPAQRGRAPRREQHLHHLRPGRLAPAHVHGPARHRASTRRSTRRARSWAGVEPEERAHRPRDVRGPRGQPHGRTRRRGVRRVPASPASGQRPRLRRPHLEHRRRAAAVPRRRRALPAPLPARPGRRVPGHQPRAVRADPRARRTRTHRSCRPGSSASSATPTSRSTPSAAPRSATSRSSSATTRTRPRSLLEQNYRSTQTILTAANS